MSLIGHDRPVTALVAGPTGGLVATGDAAGVLQVWQPLASEEPVATLHADGVVLALAWHDQGHCLAITTSSGQLIRLGVQDLARG